MKKSIFTVVPFLFFLSAFAQVKGTFVDERDNHKYKWVQIGNQVWMAENLAYLPSVNSWRGDMSDTEPHYYVHSYDGTDVQEAKNHFKKPFVGPKTPEWKFVVQDSVERIEISLPPTQIEFNIYYYFGVLYNWPAAMGDSVNRISSTSKVQGICPCGWHLPSDEEWNKLEKTLGANSDVEKEKIFRRGVVEELLKGQIDSVNLEKVKYEGQNSVLVEFEEAVKKEKKEIEEALKKGIKETEEALKKENKEFDVTKKVIKEFEEATKKEINGFEEAVKKEISHGFWNHSNIKNNSGFSALPAGWKLSTIRPSLGLAADFWSSTDANKGKAWNREILNGNVSGVYRTKQEKENGFSIRCIKD